MEILIGDGTQFSHTLKNIEYVFKTGNYFLEPTSSISRSEC